MRGHPGQGDTVATLRDIFRDHLRAVPFSSVAQVLELLGDGDPDPRFGRSCLGQSLLLADRLRERGIGEVDFLEGDRHGAVRCRTEEGAYLLDSFLMHRDPVPLDALEAKPRLTVPAFPDAGGAPSAEVRLRRYSSGTLILARYAKPPGEDALELMCHLSVRLEGVAQPVSDHARLCELMFDDAQVTLSVRTLDEGGSVLELLHPLDGRRVDAGSLAVTLDDGAPHPAGTPEHDRLLARLAATLDASPRELTEYVLHGVELFTTADPRGREAAMSTGGSE